MIQFLHSDLFEQDVEALVNTVNTVGIMGKGIAFQFSKKYPLNLKLYQKACKSGEIDIGKPFLTPTGEINGPKYIINFPTKKDWRGNSRLEYIEKGLHTLAEQIKEYRIKSIALPPLGCGNGGLDWKEVKPLMEKVLAPFSDVDIRIIEPGHLNYSKPKEKQDTPPLTKARALILTLANRYGVLGFDLSHLELQKLAYFLKEFGQPDLRLDFIKGHYGPYAANLKHLLAHLEGHYLSGKVQFQDTRPTDPLYLVREKMAEVESFGESGFSEEEKERIEKVTHLIEGFESPLGLELLATVHWAMTETRSTELQPVAIFVSNWSTRKRNLMTTDMIETALERLREFRTLAQSGIHRNAV